MKYYSDSEARSEILKACKILVEEELIARTWGNISARISEDKFIITPSGRAYESLKPEDLVVVDVNDLSYEGSIKPSSEKAAHAVSYRNRREVTFVIHTHQNYATAVGIEGKNTENIAAAKYGLAGTQKITDNISKAELEALQGKQVTEVKLEVDEGDTVMITAGAFKDSIAKVLAVNESKRSVTVGVDFMGGERKLEIGFAEIKKI